MLYRGVSHRGVVRDESGDFGLIMLALYMCFNGTGICSGETLCQANLKSFDSHKIMNLLKYAIEN